MNDSKCFGTTVKIIENVFESILKTAVKSVLFRHSSGRRGPTKLKLVYSKYLPK